MIKTDFVLKSNFAYQEKVLNDLSWFLAFFKSFLRIYEKFLSIFLMNRTIYS